MGETAQHNEGDSLQIKMPCCTQMRKEVASRETWFAPFSRQATNHCGPLDFAPHSCFCGQKRTLQKIEILFSTTYKLYVIFKDSKVATTVSIKTRVILLNNTKSCRTNTGHKKQVYRIHVLMKQGNKASQNSLPSGKMITSFHDTADSEPQ